jgi:hypothetical protein
MLLKDIFIPLMIILHIKAQILPCSTNDCLAESISSESCTEISDQPPRGSSTPFAINLSRNIDFKELGGRIIAYKIKWSSGWSGWFVPDYNDIDIKYTTIEKKWLRRRWSYFADHYHTYIICAKPSSYIP